MTPATLENPATAKRYVPEDLLTMPDGDQYELVDGQLVETKMSFLSVFTAGWIAHLLTEFSRARQLGWVVPSDAMYRCFPDDPNKVRKPDVSFIRASRYDRQAALQDAFTEVAPDLAVEVVSPSDLASEVSKKVGEYLDAGVELVWVVDPVAQTVAVHHRDRPGEILRSTDTLAGHDVLPGFECPVARLFELPPGTG